MTLLLELALVLPQRCCLLQDLTVAGWVQLLEVVQVWVMQEEGEEEGKRVEEEKGKQEEEKMAVEEQGSGRGAGKQEEGREVEDQQEGKQGEDQEEGKLEEEQMAEED